MIRLDALLLALVALAWLPANHYYPWASAWQDGIALALVAAGTLALTRAAQLPWPWLALIAFAMASVGLQWATGVTLFAGDAWIVGLYLMTFGLALISGSTLVVRQGAGADTRRLELLCLLLLAAALVSAGIGFAQWAGVQRLGIFGADLKPGARPFANFGQPNHWCTASFMGLAVAWTLFEARRIGGLAFALVAAMLLTAMVVSGSRTAWLQAGLALVIVFGLRNRAQLRLKPWAAVIALGAFVIAWAVWPLINAAADVNAARSMAAQAQAGVRIPLWQSMLTAIAERPWAGYGWNQMVLAQQAVALEGPPLRIHFEHAHNLLLDLMIWAGVPLGLAIAGLAGWALLRLATGTQDARAAGLLLACGGVLAHAMVEFPVEYAYFLMPMGLLLGAAHRLSSSAMKSLVVPTPVARSAGAVVLGMLVVTGLDYAEAEQSHRVMRMESARIGTDRVESPAPQLRVLTQLEAFLTFGRITPEANADPRQLELAHRVARRFAYPPTQFRLARWQALNGDTEGATKTLALLCAMHPVAHCEDVGNAWRRLQEEEPLLRAVAAPGAPR